MSFCLDTDVIIDCLRGTPKTIEWLTNNNTSKFYIPACRNGTYHRQPK